MKTNLEKMLFGLSSHLKKKRDEKLITGYKEAMKDFEERGDVNHKFAAELIEKELKRRGINEDLYR